MRRKLLVCLSLGALAAAGIDACADATPNEPVMSSEPACPDNPLPTTAIAPTPNGNDAGQTVTIVPAPCTNDSDAGAI